MIMLNRNTEEKQASTAKITVWYVLSSILVNALNFLTTPIFTRILSKSEYGQYSNFISWQTILEILVTLNISMSITRAKYEFDGEMEKYICSILLFSNIITGASYLIIEINNVFFTDFFSMDIFLIRVMFLYLMFHPTFVYLQIKHRIYRKYKFFIAFSLVTALIRTIVALLLVCEWNNKTYARILGDIMPITLFNMVLWIAVINRGRCMHKCHIVYAICISVPLIPHSLAGQFLAHADKIMITKYWGSEYTATYSLVYSVGALASILWSAMNQAWAPWLYDNMAAGNSHAIRKNSKIYLAVFAVIIVGILLVAPEAVLILGGEKYFSARFLMPVIVMSCVCQFIYGMYVNIEIFTKKTVQISVGTVGAGLLNIVLNLIFIPRFGYEAAAWTTLVGYAMLLVFHYGMVKKNRLYLDIYDIRYILRMIIGLLILCVCSMLLYRYNVIRYICMLIYFVALCIGVVKNKGVIVRLMR